MEALNVVADQILDCLGLPPGTDISLLKIHLRHYAADHLEDVANYLDQDARRAGQTGHAGLSVGHTEEARRRTEAGSMSKKPKDPVLTDARVRRLVKVASEFWNDEPMIGEGCGCLKCKRLLELKASLKPFQPQRGGQRG